MNSYSFSLLPFEIGKRRRKRKAKWRVWVCACRKSFKCVGARWKIINNFYVEPFSLEPRSFFCTEEKKSHVSSPDAPRMLPHEFLSDLIFIGFFFHCLLEKEKSENWNEIKVEKGRWREKVLWGLKERKPTQIEFLQVERKWIFYDLDGCFSSVPHTHAHFQRLSTWVTNINYTYLICRQHGMFQK